MTTAKKAAAKTTTNAATPKKTVKLSADERLDNLIAYLKDHGIHYVEPTEDEEETEDEDE